jgi:putative transposase
VSRATLLRKPKLKTDLPRRIAVRRLSDQERVEVLTILRSPRFVDRSPGQIVAVLWDEGRYTCSESTMYRLLREHSEVHERRRQAKHPEYYKPELMATGPGQCWSWDISVLQQHRKELALS